MCFSVLFFLEKIIFLLAWTRGECLPWQQRTSLPKSVFIRGKSFFKSLILLLCCQLAAAHMVSSMALDWEFPGSEQKGNFLKDEWFKIKFLITGTEIWHFKAAFTFHVTCSLFAPGKHIFLIEGYCETQWLSENCSFEIQEKYGIVCIGEDRRLELRLQ